ncbi:unnamed protein product [Fraxinus pennsylvanica]|uniref:Pentatricopeptide repeat-containing protein n=1 Tax=Fraxinus pennsylvanica TaxID=56036 RepID=A0AAD1ZGX6_9LAMI|nr:unnamed protein product [Fraxinus pennsylvanica]
MPKKNIVSWISMISGYIQDGLASEALRLFDEMLSDDSEVKSNWVTVMSVLPACARSAALDWARKIHASAREKMYTEAGICEEVNHLRALLKSQGVKKNLDCSWIEINGKAHLFLRGDTSHSQSKEIYRLLEELPEKIKATGY